MRALMRKAHIVPLAATVNPGSALLRSIAGKPANPPAPRPAAATREVAAPARLATGRGAAAASARHRGRRRH